MRFPCEGWPESEEASGDGECHEECYGGGQFEGKGH